MDYEHILTLLQVIEQTRNFPALKYIHDQAMGDLQDIVDEGKAPDTVYPPPQQPEQMPQPKPAPIFPRDSGVQESKPTNGLSLKPSAPEPGDA